MMKKLERQAFKVPITNSYYDYCEAYINNRWWFEGEHIKYFYNDNVPSSLNYEIINIK